MDNKEQILNALEELERYSQSSVFHSLSDDTVKIALKALEKAVPTKPNINNEYFCEKCLMTVDNEYCRWCGQKIDWSDF